MRYIQVKDTIITDSISFAYGDYIRFDGEVPVDIMNGCYRFIDGTIIHDELLHAALLAEQEALRLEFEIELEIK